MSSSRAAIEARRAQRKKELEEKRKRLAEYREKTKNKELNKLSDALGEDAKSGLTKLEGVTNLDDLLTVIGGVSREGEPTESHEKGGDTSATTTATATTATTNNSNGGTPPITTTTTTTAAAPARVRVPMQRVMGLAIHETPPRVVESYNKGTQTVDTWLPGARHQEGEENSPDNGSGDSAVVAADDANVPQQQHKVHVGFEHHDNDSNDTDKASGATNSHSHVAYPALSEFERVSLLQSESFPHTVERAAKHIERAIYINSRHDYMNDFATESGDAGKRTLDRSEWLKLDTQLSDQRWTKNRVVSDMHWSSAHSDLLVCAYSAATHATHSADPDGVVLLWTVPSMLGRPEYVFNCQSPVTAVTSVAYHPTLVVGGTYSGQLVIWDTRAAKSTPIQQTPLSSVGHTHPIFALTCVGTQNAHNLVSVSTDGRMCVWSMESLLQPIEVLELHNTASKSFTTTAPVAATCVRFPQSGVNDFFVGSEDGAVYSGCRHGNESGIVQRYAAHSGPVTGLDFHPSGGQVDFSNYFLSSSTDWSVKLWDAKNTEQPVLSFDDYSEYVYDVRWSPSNPSVFASIDGTGTLALWNLNQDAEVPVLKSASAETSLNRLAWNNTGRRVAAGDAQGNTFVWNVADDVAAPSNDAWELFEEVLASSST